MAALGKIFNGVDSPLLAELLAAREAACFMQVVAGENFELEGML